MCCGNFRNPLVFSGKAVKTSGFFIIFLMEICLRALSLCTIMKSPNSTESAYHMKGANV